MSTTEPDYKELMSRALVALKSTQERLAALERAAAEPIAIIGMACRFPGGVTTPEALWQLLIEGRDAIGPVPPERWDRDALYDPDPAAAGKMHCSQGGFVDDVAGFDPLFFGMSPKEAVFVDPQQRLMLEVAWEALENAGLAPARLAGSKTGVLVGISTMDYCNLISARLPRDEISRHIGTGTALSPAAGRIAYLLGLTGPAMAVDTACSSSLVATHLAVESLRRGETDMMIVGGVGLILSPVNSITFSKARMLAADGRCKPFSEAADGYGRGEGVAAVILKRLSDAQRDGDPILALIRGSAVNQDGASGGLTIPNGPAQQAVIRQAQANARVEAADVGYVEAHGTGTALGDPIEAGALAAVFRASHSAGDPLLLGSLKSNIGHTEAAAGLAGLLRVVLQLQHGEVPPLLHFDEPSHHIQWEGAPLRVVTRREPWQSRRGRWIAGVSSFGFSGTNAHVVLERAPEPAAVERPAVATPRVLLLSAQRPEALQALALRYAQWLSAARPNLDALCQQAAVGRAHLDERLAVLVDDLPTLQQKLLHFAAGQPPAGAWQRDGSSGRRQRYALQAPSLATLGSTGDWLRQLPAYDTAWQQCLMAATSLGFARDGQFTRDSVQRFALLYASLRVWQSLGLQPAVLAGPSDARCVLAAVSGLVSLDTALQLHLVAPTGAHALEVAAAAVRFAHPTPALHGLQTSDAVTWLAGQDSPLCDPLPATVIALADGADACLAQAYAAGADITWDALWPGQPRPHLPLPNYPFQRQAYWPNLRGE